MISSVAGKAAPRFMRSLTVLTSRKGRSSTVDVGTAGLVPLRIDQALLCCGRWGACLRNLVHILIPHFDSSVPQWLALLPPHYRVLSVIFLFSSAYSHTCNIFPFNINTTFVSINMWSTYTSGFSYFLVSVNLRKTVSYGTAMIGRTILENTT
jgi:hypothetical protein